MLASQQLRQNIHYLSSHCILDEMYNIKDEAVEDSLFERDFKDVYIPKLDVRFAEETLDILESTPKSFCRFGDGEVKLINGIDSEFQVYNPILAKKMVDILAKKRENVYVGLNSSYFDSPYKFIERNRKFYRRFNTNFRRFFASHCDQSSVYLDACCFCAYYRYGDGYDFESHYERMLNLFKGKKVAVVCGETVFNKIDNNIFERAIDLKFVYAPSKNAFDKYEQIIEQIQREIPKDYLVCLILGMTATVMAADLADLGYMAWDTGHISKDYDYYKKQISKTDNNITAFWAAD